MMKLKLIESKLLEKFDPTFDLEYDASELVEDTDDEDKYVYGTIMVEVDDVFNQLWEFIDQDDDKNQIISDEELNIFSDNDKAWETWVEKNYQMLLDRYDNKFRDIYFETALDKLYDNWDDHCDEKPFDQREDDMKSYDDLVAQGLKLR